MSGTGRLNSAIEEDLRRDTDNYNHTDSSAFNRGRWELADRCLDLHFTGDRNDPQWQMPAQDEPNYDQMEQDEFEAAKGPEEYGDTTFKSEDNEDDVIPTTEHDEEDAGGLFGSGSEDEGSMQVPPLHGRF